MAIISRKERGLCHLRAGTICGCPHEVKLNPHEMLIETTDWTERTPLPSHSHTLLRRFLGFLCNVANYIPNTNIPGQWRKVFLGIDAQNK